MKTPHCARHSAFSGTPEEVDGEMARNLGVYVEENLQLHTHVGGGEGRDRPPRRRPHVSRPAGKQVRPQRKRNCRVDNKPIRHPCKSLSRGEIRSNKGRIHLRRPTRHFHFSLAEKAADHTFAPAFIDGAFEKDTVIANTLLGNETMNNGESAPMKYENSPHAP